MCTYVCLRSFFSPLNPNRLVTGCGPRAAGATDLQGPHGSNDIAGPRQGYGWRDTWGPRDGPVAQAGMWQEPLTEPAPDKDQRVVALKSHLPRFNEQVGSLHNWPGCFQLASAPRDWHRLSRLSILSMGDFPSCSQNQEHLLFGLFEKSLRVPGPCSYYCWRYEEMQIQQQKEDLREEDNRVTEVVLKWCSTFALFFLYFQDWPQC